MNSPDDGPDDLARRYARRAAAPGGIDRYHPLQPDVVCTLHERQRAMLALLRRAGWNDLAGRRIVEVGCGSAGNLLELLRLGATPDRLLGIELLPDRLGQARARLPPALQLWLGDARQAPVAPASQDLVLLATVLSSLLDDGTQAGLAKAVWRWLKPGGAVLCYDFTLDNPSNPDVRGVPLRRLRALFPEATSCSRRVTLAPPLARPLCRWHPGLYPWVNALPLLRTHRLTWLEKA